MVVNGAGRETQFWGALQHCTLGLRVGHRLLIKESERLCVREKYGGLEEFVLVLRIAG